MGFLLRLRRRRGIGAADRDVSTVPAHHEVENEGAHAADVDGQSEAGNHVVADFARS